MKWTCPLYFVSEPQKASECFTLAKEGLTNEAFLRERLLQTDETHIRKLEVLYYLKVKLQTFADLEMLNFLCNLAMTSSITGNSCVQWLSSWIFEQGVWGLNLGLTIMISEIGYLLLLSDNLTETLLKRRKSLKYPQQFFYYK